MDKGSTILKILGSILASNIVTSGGGAPLVLAAGDEASDERMFQV